MGIKTLHSIQINNNKYAKVIVKRNLLFIIQMGFQYFYHYGGMENFNV